MSDFFPKGYEVPQKSGNYMKFQDGENRFRILSAPIMGYEWWVETEDGTRKPKRIDMDTKISASEVDPQELKHFWAMIVYNVKEDKIQILEITQKGIQKAIRALEKSAGWGDPTEYNISVTKSGQKLETEYSVMPEPKEKIDKGIIKLMEDMQIDLTALYRGEDPFNSDKLADDAVKAGL